MSFVRSFGVLTCAFAVPVQFVLGFLCLFSSCFGDWRFLSGFRTCASATIASPLQSPRCQGLLTLSKTHDSDCPVYSLSTLFNKLFSAFATGFRIYFLTLSGLHKRVCCRFLYVVFINFSKYYNL